MEMETNVMGAACPDAFRNAGLGSLLVWGASANSSADGETVKDGMVTRYATFFVESDASP